MSIGKKILIILVLFIVYLIIVFFILNNVSERQENHTWTVEADPVEESAFSIQYFLV